MYESCSGSSEIFYFINFIKGNWLTCGLRSRNKIVQLASEHMQTFGIVKQNSRFIKIRINNQPSLSSLLALRSGGGGLRG